VKVNKSNNLQTTKQTTPYIPILSNNHKLGVHLSYPVLPNIKTAPYSYLIYSILYIVYNYIDKKHQQKINKMII